MQVGTGCLEVQCVVEHALPVDRYTEGSVLDGPHLFEAVMCPFFVDAGGPFAEAGRIGVELDLHPSVSGG